MGRLEGKAALITGGGTGIGRAIALRFAAEGARVVIAQRNAEALDATVADIEADGGWARAVPTDITQTDQVLALVDQAIEATGRLDILVNNAGRTGRAGAFLDVDLDVWRDFIETNLTGPFVIAQAVARHMVSAGVAGRIINTGSVDSFRLGDAGRALRRQQGRPADAHAQHGHRARRARHRGQSAGARSDPGRQERAALSGPPRWWPNAPRPFPWVPSDGSRTWPRRRCSWPATSANT